MISNSNHHDLNSKSTNSRLYSSVDNPDSDFFLKAVAYFLNSILLTGAEEENQRVDEIRENEGGNVNVNMSEQFADNQRNIENSDTNSNSITNNDTISLPSVDDIHSYILNTFLKLEMNTEMLICAVIYILRAAEKGIKLLPTNWMSIIFISQVLAKKVLDYESLPELHYKILSAISGNVLSEDEIKEKEEKFLFSISYHTTVKHSIYLRFFMELKKLLREEYFEEVAKLKPMSKQDFVKITEESINYEEQIKKKLKTS